MNWREHIVLFCKAQVGGLVQWRGGHSDCPEPHYGYDCYGLVVAALRGLGIDYDELPRDMFARLPAVEAPQPADLVFYGPDEGGNYHVAIATEWDPIARKASIVEAVCGGPWVTTPEEAKRCRAWIKFKPEHDVMRSLTFAGFRTLEPIVAEKQ